MRWYAKNLSLSYRKDEQSAGKSIRFIVKSRHFIDCSRIGRIRMCQLNNVSQLVVCSFQELPVKQSNKSFTLDNLGLYVKIVQNT